MQKAKLQFKIQKLIFYAIISAFLFSGCGRTSENTLKEVVEKDPSFAKILETKKSVDSKIFSLKEELEKDNDAAMQKINLVKEGLREKKNALNMEILALKEKLSPDIGVLEGKLAEKLGEYKLKAIDLKNLTQKSKNIKKLLNKKSELSLTGDEEITWNKRAANLEGDIASRQIEISRLKEKIRVLKTEIRILKE